MTSTRPLPPTHRPPHVTALPSESTTQHPTQQPSIISLKPSSKKEQSKSKKIFRRVRSVFRSLPIIAPSCKMPGPLHDRQVHLHGGTRVTGTLFGYRKARVNLVIQENPRCLPLLVLELAIPTGKLLQEMGAGLVRIALECEKKPAVEKTKIVDELIWTMYCNGRKSGYGVKREATKEDLGVMQMVHAVSMGAGVIPTATDGNEQEGDLTYMRVQFERVIGSRDSETFYMLAPDRDNGPELIIFFVRI